MFPIAWSSKLGSVHVGRDFFFFFLKPTSVDTEMCCPKGKCGCQYFILLTLEKKIHGHRGPGFFFNKKTSVDTEMCCPKGKCGCQYFILLT